MNADSIRRLIEDQRNEIERKIKKEKIIDREKKDEIKPFIEHPNILVILGVRRCGKSIFSYLTFKGKNFGYVNFDDERLLDFQTNDFDNLLKALYGLYGKELNCFIFDEIQNVEKWEKFTARMRVNNKIIITGSNSKLLSSELATSLTGRHIDYILFPFSFNEYLIYNDFKPNLNLTRDIGLVKKFIERYIQIGGFPEVYKFGENIVRNIYSDIIEKDIIRRFEIRKQNELRNMARYLITNSSKEISYNKLKDIFHLNITTVKEYIDYLSMPYLLFFIEKFSFKLKEQILAPRKVYCVDNGIINTVSFKFSKDLGRLMENCVSIRLIKNKLNTHNLDVFYWKDYQQREVDFVLKEGLIVKQLIQVTYASDKDEIEKREIKSLIKASNELNCKDLLIITWDYEDEIISDNKKIKCIPLWRWLLESNIL